MNWTGVQYHDGLRSPYSRYGRGNGFGARSGTDYANGTGAGNGHYAQRGDGFGARKHDF